MAGGFTKIPKLQVEDLGTEGTGDRIALFNSDGELVGYMMAGGLSIVINSTAGITIDSKYISVSRLHRAKTTP